MSVKRTVLDLRELGDVEAAWAKSSASSSELGCETVAAAEEEGWPWNWVVRSSSCFWSVEMDPERSDAPLCTRWGQLVVEKSYTCVERTDVASPASLRRSSSSRRAARPSRN